MHIRSYETRRFAGLKYTSIEFERGLNVILGNNETGKSTIIEGIHSTLFKDIKLRKNNNADKDFIFKFMPQPNGDFIDGRVVLNSSKGDYEISKEWGTSEDIRLVTPEGNIIKNKKDINEELSKILSFGESTYSNIVFAKQRDLKEALYNIINNNEVTKEINDLLRMTLMELDGVSVDHIQKNIEDEIDDLYKRWDRDKNYPENNRGINNPYKVGLGKIVKSYYDKENLKRRMERAYKTEKEFADISDNIKKIQDEREVINEEKIKLEKIEDDANNRSILDVEIQSVNQELESLMEANREWPKTEQLLEQLDEKLDDLKKEKEGLNEEKSNLEKINLKESTEKKLKRIDEIQIKINNIIENINEIPPITNEDIDKLTRIERDLLTFQTTMKAGKMIGVVNKKPSDKSVYLKKDLQESEILELATEFEANGLINITYGDEFELEIRTGEIDFHEISNQYKTLKGEEEELLKKLNIDGLSTSKVNLEKIRTKESEKESLNKEVDLLLDNKTREDLEEELKALGNINVYRDLEDIEGELQKINEDEISFLADKRSMEAKLEIWKAQYKDHDSLFDLVIDERTKLKEKEKKLEDLKPLPEEFETVDDFKSKLMKLKGQSTILQGKLDLSNTDYYEAKNALLEDTYEELKKEYLEAEKTFEKNINRGKKLLEIQRVFMETKERLSTNPMDSLVNEFTRFLELITAGRYEAGEIDEEFNIKLENPNGEMPIELLSAGTYDSVSLALRFSLLKHIFKDSGGYLVLDDCLVDLDPIRKKQAVNLINDFAKDYQIIFTTCDPETADMLGGKIIEL